MIKELYEITNDDFNNGAKYAFEFAKLMLNNSIFDKEDVIGILEKQISKIEGATKNEK